MQTSAEELNVAVCDESAIARLLERLLTRARLSPRQASRALGLGDNAVQQYVYGRRCRPSLLWFLRLANLCGARVVLEFHPKR